MRLIQNVEPGGVDLILIDPYLEKLLLLVEIQRQEMWVAPEESRSRLDTQKQLFAWHNVHSQRHVVGGNRV